MITSDEQRAIVAGQLRDLQAWRDRLLDKPDRDEYERRLVVLGVESMIARLERQIDVYENASSGNLPPVLTALVEDEEFRPVVEALVQLRVAKGMSREDVARAAGRCPSSIAQWESEEYLGYSLQELVRLAAALGRELHISFVAPDARTEQRELEQPEPEALTPVGTRE